MWPYLWKYRRGMALGMGALLLTDLMKAALPLAIRSGIDSLMKGFRLSLVFEFAALIVLLSVVKGIFQYWMRVILIGLSRDIEFDLRNDLFSHIVTLSQDFYAKYRTGDIMARATNDLNAVRMMLGPGIMYFTETFFTAVFLIGVMSRVDWRLTLFCLIPAPLVSIAVILFGRRIHDRFETIQKMFSDISSRVQENLSGVRVIRAYAQEQRRDPQVRAAESGLRRAEHPAREALGAFHAVAASPDRDRIPDRAAGRRLSVARSIAFRSAASSCSTPTWAC